MNRREFLLLRPGQPDPSLELSCERLYMKYLDASLNGTTAALFRGLDAELRRVKTLRLVDSAWLTRDDLERQLEPLLAAFRARGGRTTVE